MNNNLTSQNTSLDEGKRHREISRVHCKGWIQVWHGPNHAKSWIIQLCLIPVYHLPVCGILRDKYFLINTNMRVQRPLDTLSFLVVNPHNNVSAQHFLWGHENSIWHAKHHLVQHQDRVNPFYPGREPLPQINKHFCNRANENRWVFCHH